MSSRQSDGQQPVDEAIWDRIAEEPERWGIAYASETCIVLIRRLDDSEVER
jgi:hypothetical protein